MAIMLRKGVSNWLDCWEREREWLAGVAGRCASSELEWGEGDGSGQREG